MEKPQPKLLLNPPASAWSGSLRESQVTRIFLSLHLLDARQEQQLSATAFGRALLAATREARARHIVVRLSPWPMIVDDDRQVDRLREQWTCPICDSFFVISGESGATGLLAAPLGSEHKHAVRIRMHIKPLSTTPRSRLPLPQIYCHHCLCQWIEAQLSESTCFGELNDDTHALAQTAVKCGVS